MGINRIVVNIIEHFPEMNSQGKNRPDDCKGINTCATNIIRLFNGEHDANQRGWIPVGLSVLTLVLWRCGHSLK